MSERQSHARTPELSVGPMMLIPIGSTEQHGPHLPLGLDTVIAEAVARRAADLIRQTGVDVLIAPALAYGASGEHQHLAGTVCLGLEALQHLLVELVRSASSWAGRCVFVNGHGENVPAVASAVRQLRYEGHDVGWAHCAPTTQRNPAPVDSRAELIQRSLALILTPDDARLDSAEAGALEPLFARQSRMHVAGVPAGSPSGVLGNPSGASAQEGLLLLWGMVADLVSSVVAWAPDSQGRLCDQRREVVA
jgi:mycofactocin precursor peptide peptidase